MRPLHSPKGYHRGRFGGIGQFWMLLVLFGAAALLTQVMSVSATTALFGPVAAAPAQALGQPTVP